MGPAPTGLMTKLAWNDGENWLCTDHPEPLGPA